MPKLPIYSGKSLLNILKKKGFVVLRQKGSHVLLQSKDGKNKTVIPVHSNEDLSKGLIKRILRDLNLSVEDLLQKR